MSAITDNQRKALSHWATGKQRIRRLSLFGSRVKGTNRPESDLDIAVELEPGEDSDATFAMWALESDKWKSELAARFSFPIDLQWHDPAGSTPTIEQGLQEACDVVYERAC